MPSAAAAPTPQAWDLSKTYDETFNNYTTALNVTTNASTEMLFDMDCSANDVDVLSVWMPAGRDLRFHIYLGDPAFAPPTRFEGHLKSPEHFELAFEGQITAQAGIVDYYFDTTTRMDGSYYLFLQRCVNVNGLYNVTWWSNVTGVSSDNNNRLSEATTISDGLTVTNSVTEPTDQQDFFRLDATFTPPPYLYFQITNLTCSPYQVEFYNATGVALEDPNPIYPVGNTCFFIVSPAAYRLPPSGTYYIRIWTNGQTSSYSITFGVFNYNPNLPTCFDFSTTCVATDNWINNSGVNALDYSFERTHMFKIFLPENATIWVNATSTQIDISSRLYNQSLNGSTYSKAAASHVFPSGGEDVEAFSYRMNAAELGYTTHWYFIEVRMNSGLPAAGRYSLKVWINDRPIALNQSVTTDEDVPVIGYNLNTLFYDNDCKLGDLPDCTPRINMTGSDPAGFNFTFDGSYMVNVTATANWSGAGCRNFQGFDPKNLSVTAQLCVTVLAVNDPPRNVAAPTSFQMTEDVTVTAKNIGLWFADADGDVLSYAVSGNYNITISIDNATGFADLSPERNFNGQNAVVWEACDTNGTCVDAAALIIVGPVNDPPEARGSIPFQECNEDSLVSVNLATLSYNGTLGTFFDIDGDNLTYRVAGVPAEIDVDVTGPVITIRPHPDVANIYYFEVRAWDGHEESFPASVRVTVLAVNDPPVVNVKTPPVSPATVQEGSFKDFAVTATDVDGNLLNYTWFVDGVGQNGQVQPTFRYAAEVSSAGNRSVVLKVNISDSHGGYAEASWTLLIENLNQAPTNVTITSPTAGHLTFAEGDEISFSSTATDPDGDTLTYSWSSDRVFAPIGDQQTFATKLAAGTHDVTLRVSDGHGGEGRTNVTVVVTPKTNNGPGDNTMLVVGAVVVIAAVAAVAVLMMRRKKPQQRQ